MSDQKLSRIDRLAIRSSITGVPMNQRQLEKWKTQYGVTSYDDGTYSLKEGSPPDSFQKTVSEIYKGNDNATAFHHKVENGGDFRGVMGKLSSSGIGIAAGDIFSNIGSTIGNKYGDDFSEEQKATHSTVRSALNSIPVYGPIISAATGLVDAIGTTTGLNLSNIDKDSASRAGAGGSATFNNLMNMLPGNSMLWGWMGSRTDDFTKSDLISNLGNAFGGTMADIDAAGDLAEKRVLFGQTKMNSFISEAKTNQNKMIAINDINSTRLKGVTSEAMSDYNNQRNVKYQGSTYHAVGKHGMKLMSIEEVNKILNSRKTTTDIQEFKNGGVIGIDSSIIPEGKLHAHKHNLKDANPDLEDVTKKGIPIVTLDEGGELQQVAEIEKEEIIFRKEVTTKLEELYKDGSDEAMIEAGKLIAEELMTNTDDKTEEFINE